MSSSNANSLITQVSRNGEPAVAPAPRKKSFIEYLCCCCFPSQPERADDYRIKDIGLESVSDSTGLLPPLAKNMQGKKTLVLDLDETLVHSSFKPIPNPDYIVPVEIEDQIHKFYVLKRPHVDQFLKELGPYFEIVVFTASLSKYADPLLDMLDVHKVVKHRLFREACTNYKGNYVKDMSRIGRELKHSIIIDNSPTSYLFHPENAVPCESWFDDETDTELQEFIPFLKDLSSSSVDDVRSYLDARKRDGRVILN